MAKQDSSRGIRLSRSALLHARKVKCRLTQEQLAEKVGLNVREIQRAEAEENIDPAFADLIAQGLGERLTDLVKKDDSPPDEEPPKSPSSDPGSPQERDAIEEQIQKIGDAIGRLYAELVKATHLTSDFRTQAIASVNAISAELLLMDPIPVDEIYGRVGSLIITFPISRRDAQTLMSAFIAGRLAKFDIKSATISSEPFASPETEHAKSLWEATPFKYSVGQVVDAIVSFVGDFGAYVELEPGITGLIHISEIAFPMPTIEAAVTDPRDVLTIGQRIKARIISIDTQHQRIQLSRRRAAVPKPTTTPSQ
jgi:predicted RNA-binding protein with RPS1 domain/transcriptional regulator with XRE-family HTH domain